VKVATAQQMRNIDKRAIDGKGIPGIELMEKAGCGAFEAVSRFHGPLKGKKMVILCGAGNNGGDGFVVARYAINKGAHCSVFLLSSKERVSGDARINLERMEKLGREITEVDKDSAGKVLEGALSGAEIVVDALLGSGLTGEVRGIYLTGIEAINSSRASVVSIDNPSGIDMDTGAVLGKAVRADLTVTFGLPKRGHFLYPGKEYCGCVEVIDIGFPLEVIEEERITLETLGADEARKFLPPRKDDAHKGDFGHLLVLAGSTGYTGAAALASESALRVGTGLVTLGIPESLNAVLEAKLTEVITRPLPDTGNGSFSINALKPVLDLCSGMDAVVMGPGLSLNEETQKFVREFMLECDLPVVLDADGVNAFVDHSDLFKGRSAPTILTPHPGEMGRLIGKTGRDINASRVDLCLELAGKWNVVLVLKGAPTIISEYGGECFINTTGSSGLATGGTGDVLSGAVGGFLAQGMDTFPAALCGVYYHGLAGDIVCGQVGGRGMIAGDVMNFLPEALNS
jgi:NAD(P)H-hydrate epimerase